VTTYRLTRQADRNLGEIFLYAAEHFGIRQADLYADELDHVFGLLASHPMMGRPADKIRPGMRRHEQAGHVIFYRPIDGGVLIVAMVHRPMRLDLDPED
jgi:toxin ParE1/3/4